MTPRRWTLVVLVALLGILPAVGQKQSPPPGGQPKDFNLPQRQSLTLDNGLRATMVPYGVLPKVTVSIHVRSGSLNEEANQVWLSDLTGDLMQEGTASMDARTLAASFAEMGGELAVNAGSDVTTFTTDVLAEFGPRALKLLAELVQKPALPGSELERLKTDRIRQLSIARAQAQPQANEKFAQIIYGDHPYGRIFPTEEMIQGYDLETVRGFYRSNFGAKRTRVYAVGVFDAKAMAEAIRAEFSGWESGPEPLIRAPKMNSSRLVHLVDRPGAPQSTLRIGLPIIDPSHADYTRVLVTNTLLGGYFSSRITSNIREDKGYTYSPGSQVSSSYRASHWVQTADVTTDVTGASLKEIFYEIDHLQEGAPPADELDGVQNYMAGVFVLQNSSRGGIVNQLALVDLHGLSDNYLTGYVGRVLAVTPDEVKTTAEKYLRDGEMTIVVVGDVEQIRAQVGPYGALAE